MNDQALALRQIVSNIKNQRAREPGTGARVIAVTSGKGGVGKSSFTVNLALSLCKKGLRVLIMDADFGLANVDVLLGLTPPYDLSHIISREKEVRDVIAEGPHGLRFLSGGSGVQELIHLSQDKLDALMGNLLQLEDSADIILIDTGAGITQNIMRLIDSSQEVVVITTPEPTAIMDAYALVKSLAEENKDVRLRLVVNKADSVREAENTLSKFAGVVRLYLKVDLEELGYILADPAVGQAVRLQQPFLLSYPRSTAARNIEHIAWKLMSAAPEKNSGLREFFQRLTKR